VRTARSNLAATGLADRARVARRDAFDVLAGAPDHPYDLVFVAPPQYKGLWRRVVEALDEHPAWLADGGQIIVQIHPREAAPLALRHFVRTDERRYGSVLLQFWTKLEPGAGAP